MQHYPQAGWVEHDGEQIKKAVRESVISALSSATINPSEISAIAITNQRETIGLFDHKTKAHTPFIVWQCRRSQSICDELKEKNLEKRLHALTGLYLDPYFSASKLSWLFRDNPSLKNKAERRELLAGTIDTFLLHWLSAGNFHVSDVTNASRTMLMDLRNLKWSDECLDIFAIPKNCLPHISNNTGDFGHTKGLDFLPDNIPIAALIGDQQAALCGQYCFKSGDAKATFGTGSFILLNTGKDPYFSKHGLLTSVAYKIGDDVRYCLEGSAFIAGAAFDFLINAFGLIKDADEIESLAKSVKDSAGVIFVPALCGLGAPHWNSHARGLLSGLSRATTKGHIARATLEGIALQNADICNAMIEDAHPITKLKVDGGASVNDLLMQLHADLLAIPCIRSLSAQKTALGAAYLAGHYRGIFPNLDDLKTLDTATTTFKPAHDRSSILASQKAYRDALKKL
jgi:glycerol kinase